jgi:hypothetical protein
MKPTLRWKLLWAVLMLVCFILFTLCVQGCGSDVENNFAGHWTHYSDYSEDHIFLMSDGTFRASGESYYYGRTGQMGEVPGSLAYGSQQASGNWRVKGTLSEGILTLSFHDGRVSQVSYRVNAKGGRIYLSEYYFNGIFYFKQKSYR